MPLDKPVRRTAIGGTEVIGASGASQYYLARGFGVTATDPAAHTCPNDGSYHEES